MNRGPWAVRRPQNGYLRTDIKHVTCVVRTRKNDATSGFAELTPAVGSRKFPISHCATRRPCLPEAPPAWLASIARILCPSSGGAVRENQNRATFTTSPEIVSNAPGPRREPFQLRVSSNAHATPNSGPKTASSAASPERTRRVSRKSRQRRQRRSPGRPCPFHRRARCGPSGYRPACPAPGTAHWSRPGGICRAAVRRRGIPLAASPNTAAPGILLCRASGPHRAAPQPPRNAAVKSASSRPAVSGR